MKRTYFLITVLLLSFVLVARTYSQQQAKESSGMESIELGPGVSVFAPQGAKMKEHKGVITLEENSEYLSRRFSEFEERLNKLEETAQDTQEKLGQLEEVLVQIKEKLSEKDEE